MRSTPPGLAALAALTGVVFDVKGDDIDRAIKVMSAGAPRPPRRLPPDEFEQRLAAAIDAYRLRAEVEALAGDEVDDDEFDVAVDAWWTARNTALSEAGRGLRRELLGERADVVAFIVDDIRTRRRVWLEQISRVPNISASER